MIHASSADAPSIIPVAQHHAGETLAAEDLALVTTIAGWHAILAVNSTGGQGMAPRSAGPAAVKYPQWANRYDQAVNQLGWVATRLPHGIAQRVCNGIPHGIWTQRRQAAGNPPLLSDARAGALYQAIRQRTDNYRSLAGGYGHHAVSNIITAMSTPGKSV